MTDDGKANHVETVKVSIYVRDVQTRRVEKKKNSNASPEMVLKEGRGGNGKGEWKKDRGNSGTGNLM